MTLNDRFELKNLPDLDTDGDTDEAPIIYR